MSWIVAAVVIGGIGAILAVAARVLLTKQRMPPPPPSLAIDLAALGTQGPPDGGPALECYNVPVRLAALVLAPVGRGEIPTPARLPAALDQLTPGLSAVVAAHRTVIREWPRQLSPRGFAQAFFAQVKLPGDRGVGTPWCALAGRLECDPPLMVGVVLRAVGPNGLGQFPIERSRQWLDALRVRV